MKSVLYSLFILQFFLISCGPSAEQQAEAARMVEDSIAAANAQMEAAKEAARQQAIEDSIAQAETVVPDSIQ